MMPTLHKNNTMRPPGLLVAYSFQPSVSLGGEPSFIFCKWLRTYKSLLPDAKHPPDSEHCICLPRYLAYSREHVISEGKGQYIARNKVSSCRSENYRWDKLSSDHGMMEGEE